MRKVRLVLATVIAVTALFALTVASANGAVPTNKIRIQGLAFNPNYITASPGEAIHVINVDLRSHDVPHTVDANNGEFDVDLIEEESGTFYAPTTPGRYHYHCDIHPFMKGILDVSG